MSDLTITRINERIDRLEDKTNKLFRSRSGLMIQPGQNVLGQNSTVDGDLLVKGILTAEGISTVAISVHSHESDALGGKLDHGAALTGLLDDDHPQYLDTFRHDTTTRHTLGTVVPVVTLSAGAGLSGGGALSANRTISINAGDGINLSGGYLGVLAGNGIVVDSSGVQTNESYAHVWGADQTFKEGIIAHNITPEDTDTYDLGSSTKLWRKGWLSELDTVLFAQNTQVLLGGWFVVSKGEGSLPSDLAAADTTYDFGQTMTVGDFIELRSSLAVEYIQVGSLVSGTTYNITRDLDGSGANAWPAGIAYRINGQAGNGRIELNAYSSPRISILSQGATYNAQTEQGRFGDLNGNWGYSAETYGIALGQYASGIGNLTYDPTNGLRLRTYSTTVMQFSGGNADITGKLRMPGASSAIAIGSTPPTSATSGTGIWIDRTGIYALASGVQQVVINATTGKLTFGDGFGALDVNGIKLPVGDGDNSSIRWRSELGPTTYAKIWNTVGSDGYSATYIDGLGYDGKPATVSLRSFNAGSLAGITTLWGTKLSHSGNIEYAGSLQSLKNSVAYAGYIYVPLDTPLTSTSWDGSTTRSTTSATLLDTSAVWGVPAGVKAIVFQASVRDSGSAGADTYLTMGPTTSGLWTTISPYPVANRYYRGTAIVNCNSDGDFYYSITASGANTFRVGLIVIGYYI